MKSFFLKGLLCLCICLFSQGVRAGSNAYKSSAFGYGAGATGGGNATPTLVSTVDALEAALTASGSKVIIVTKSLTFTNHLSVLATNKTLLALPGVTFTSNQQNKSYSGILYFKKGSSNLILRNLTFIGPGAYDCDGWDNLCFDGVTKAWVDHCDFQDGCDGNFDNKGLTDNITVSWCRFRYLKAPKAGGSGGTNDHRFSNLLGSSSSDKPADGTYNMTWAYCWWDEGCVERMLRCRNAYIHFLNCAWTSNAAHYFVGPQNAKALFDGCYFITPSNKVSSGNFIFYQNYGGTNACKFNNCSGPSSYMTNSGSVASPSYSYSTLSASTAYADLKAYAGATLNVTTSGAISEGGSSSSSSGSSSSSSSGSSTTTTSSTLVTFTGSKPSSSAVTVSGNYSTSKGSVTINGKTYTTCVKMESATSIKLTLSSSSSVTFYFNSAGSFKVNGTSFTSSSSGFSRTLTLSAGTYTITKGDSMNLFAIGIGSSASGKSDLTLDVESEEPEFGFATDIESIRTAEEEVVIYTLNGVRVSDTDNLPAGFYIRNGKKILVR